MENGKPDQLWGIVADYHGPKHLPENAECWIDMMNGDGRKWEFCILGKKPSRPFVMYLNFRDMRNWRAERIPPYIVDLIMKTFTTEKECLVWVDELPTPM